MRFSEELPTATDANHAVPEQYQISQEQHASSPQVALAVLAHQAALATERSTTGTEPDVSAATHTPERREDTPSVWLMTAAVAKSSHGLVPARLALMASSQMQTEEAAFPHHLFD
jgi:hypothetical protein